MFDVNLPVSAADFRNLIAERGIVPALAQLNDRTLFR
jgi:hypothetical protein